MRAPSIVIEIEEIPEGTEPELIELAAADRVSFRAISTLRSTDRVRFVPTVHRQDPAHAPLDSSPKMVVAVGDGRADGCGRTLNGLRRTGVLSVAIVAVDSLQSLTGMDERAHDFDAVLRVVVPRGVDAEVPLARAAAAVTDFAAADRISVPVDETYPFFVHGGQLTWGSAEGDDLVGAAAMALAAARLNASSRRVRMLLHIESTEGDMMRDYELVALSIGRAVRIDELWITVSVSRASRKGISVVAAAVRS